MMNRVLGVRRDTVRLAVLGVLAVGLGLAPPHGAQERKLNGSLGANGDVVQFLISADEAHVLYVADQEVDGQFDLYSVRLDARTAPVRLSDVPPSGGGVVSAASSHERVVFCGQNLVGNAIQLYSVPLEGGTPVVLNPPLVAGGGVLANFLQFTPLVTPDETRVLYVADQDVNNVFELYVVPIDGSGPAIQLNHALPAGWDVSGFALDPTGSTALYFTEVGFGSTHRQVWSVPLDGSSSPVQLADHPSCENLTNARFSSDGQWVSYHVEIVGLVADLYLVPADASQPAILLNDNMPLYNPPGGSVRSSTFTTAGDRVVFRESFSNESVIFFSWLYSSTLDGQAAALGTEEGNVTSHLLDPDGSTVFFASDEGLFRVPADGSATLTILQPAWTVNSALTGDGTRLAYTTRSGSQHVGLYSLPSTGGAPTELHLLTPGQELHSVAVSADSRHVVYRVRASPTSTTYELYSAAIDGASAPQRLHGALPPGGTVTAYRLSGGRVRSAGPDYRPAGGRVIFLGDLDTDNVMELFLSYPGPAERAPKSAAPPKQPAGS